jgi:hypothetical protein
MALGFVRTLIYGLLPFPVKKCKSSDQIEASIAIKYKMRVPFFWKKMAGALP